MPPRISIRAIRRLLAPFVPFVMVGALAAVPVGAVAPATPPASPPATPEDSQPSFAELARDFREAHDLVGEEVDSLENALEKAGGFVSLELGTFRIWYPGELLEDKKRAAELERNVLALVDLHRVWTSWVDLRREGYEQAVEDLETLRDWVASWSSGRLRRIELGSSTSLYELLEAGDDVQEAARRLRAFVLEGVKSEAWDGGWGEGVRITPLVLAPSRKIFLSLVALGGEIDVESRTTLWSEAQVGVNSAWVGRTQIVALENPVLPPDPDSPFAGASMDHFDEKGQEQFVVERAAISLLRDLYFYYGIHFFESALATNLVIAVFGRNTLGFSWSMSWRRERAQTQGYSRFVPGGNPSGGRLPQRRAKARVTMSTSYVSPWDDSKGEEFFLEPLQEAQEDGAKQARRDDDLPLHDDDRPHFEIRTEQGRRTVVSAPFFGKPAEGKPLPPHEFLDAYEDFFRAYRSAFFEWIRTRALGDEEESRERFAALVEAQANRVSETEPLHAVVERVYGMPLSHEDDSVDNLEWRFLSWLEDA